MNIIQNLTDDTKQKNNYVLPNGNRLTLTIKFVPLQIGWFIQDLTYGDFDLKGVRIVTSPNILNQFRHQIPFGIACFTQDYGEPKLQEDFSSGYATLYLLTEDETTEVAGLLSLG